MSSTRGAYLTGSSIKDSFGYLETLDGKPDFRVIQNIIQNGHHEGKVLYVIRSFVRPEICQEACKSFDLELQANGGSRPADEFVITHQVGATQFSRNGQAYVDESLRVGKSLSRVMDRVSQKSIEDMFLTRFLEERFLGENIHFGPARYKNGYATFATFRSWLDNGVMSLMPHEDVAQLEFAKEDGFEIHSATSVVAFNVCLDASLEGGELVIWNFKPDAKCRAHYGVSKTGYPYPPEDLTGLESVSVKLNPGDVYFMNASHLHGVRSTRVGRRLTAGRFIAQISDTKAVFWT